MSQESAVLNAAMARGWDPYQQTLEAFILSRIPHEDYIITEIRLILAREGWVSDTDTDVAFRYRHELLPGQSLSGIEAIGAWLDYLRRERRETEGVSA